MTYLLACRLKRFLRLLVHTPFSLSLECFSCLDEMSNVFGGLAAQLRPLSRTRRACASYYRRRFVVLERVNNTASHDNILMPIESIILILSFFNISCIPRRLQLDEFSEINFNVSIGYSYRDGEGRKWLFHTLCICLGLIFCEGVACLNRTQSQHVPMNFIHAICPQ